jgi:AAA+ ATPase superfamily predicted ATPase
MFIGRAQELSALHEGYASPRSELYVIYGRRRIGKSTLLERFVEDKTAFFYLAGKESKRLQLKRFVKELGDTIGDPLTGRVGVTAWDEALTLLDRNIAPFCEHNHCAKAIIVFDEFQWMCHGAPELLSDLQRFWDKRWKDSTNVCLVLCGSSTSFMLGDVLSRKSPLFGRRTRSFRLGAFSAEEASELLPGRGAFEVAETWFTVGGIPKYLEIMAAQPSLRKAVSREAFSPSGFFFDEIRFVLGEQLKETEHYFQLLEHMAKSPVRITELERMTGIASGQVTYYLERLLLLGFVSRHIPFGAKHTSKTVRYRLDDYYLRFYFKFIHPNRGRIESASAPLPWRDVVGDAWHNWAGLSFERFAWDHAHVVAARLGHDFTEVGSFWQRPTKRKQGVQVDLLIGCEDGVALLCECKWSRTPIGMPAVHELRKKIALFPNGNRHTLKPVLIASGGVTRPVRQESDVSVVELADFWPRT